MAEIVKRPTVFIGSSAENGLPIAKAIQLNLDRACEVVIWSQGVFGLGGGTLEDLVSQLADFDFAVLVLTPDDVVTKRSVTSQQPRDNVLLELGMFLGALGRRRTFIVYDRTSALELPSDLAGVTPAVFQKHASGNLLSSLGAPSTQIEAAIKDLGLKPSPKLSFDIDQNTHFQVIADLLETSALQYIILMDVENKSLPRDRMFAPGLQYHYQFKGVSGGSGGFSIAEMCRKLPDAGLLSQDLRGDVRLTDRGRVFAKWLVEHGRKADDFVCPFGGWGDTSFRMSQFSPPAPNVVSSIDGTFATPTLTKGTHSPQLLPIRIRQLSWILRLHGRGRRCQRKRVNLR